MTEFSNGLMAHPPVRRLVKSYFAWFAGSSLAASFWAPFIVTPIKTANLFEAVDLAAQLKSAVSAMDLIGTSIGSSFPTGNPAPVDHSAQFAAAVLGAAPALYLNPALAVAILIAVATGRDGRKMALVHGVLSVAMTTLIFIAMSKLGASVGAEGVATGTLGIGFWIIAACGLGQLAAAVHLLGSDPTQLFKGPSSPPSAPAE